VKIILSVIVVVLMIDAPSEYSETAYQSGFNYGCNDVDKGVNLCHDKHILT
jgi:hypothetical protein